MTEEDLKQFLAENAADIQAQVRQRLIEGLLTNHSWTMRDQIGEVVADFMKTEIIPEVRTYLSGEKSAILEAAIKGASKVSDMLAEAMVAQAAKNLSANRYEFKKIMEAVFA
ncbi:hypothetical protein GCM10011491_30430 [Brucella endophytica]|uniref:Uncharacterized protein n=1 Tax=Brucella endophytica TaxID=1963359 RepID=A0A916SGZ5_9HYPH|nr:hypothetical protein [Brucella endophytica]GGB00085.1 hypothetical protein GCM10011491_30430 [Brucella endophytica]